jgi:hypothetical protein
MIWNWLASIENKASSIYVGVATFMWAIQWFTSFMYVVFREALYLLRFWSMWQHDTTRESVHATSKASKVIIFYIFTKTGWRSNDRSCL